MKLQKESRLAWGITLLVFGVIFLVRQLQILTPEVADIVFNIRNYPFIIGLIFLIVQKNKNTGIVLIVIGLLFNLSVIIRFTHNISDYTWPVILILIGIFMIFGKSKKKK